MRKQNHTFDSVFFKTDLIRLYPEKEWGAMRPFDLNHDGETSLFENMYVGNMLTGAVSLGLEAQERANQKNHEIEELERKIERLEQECRSELEDEFWMDEDSDFDSIDGFNDDYDDDDSIEDFYYKDPDYKPVSFRSSNDVDIKNARKVAAHLRSEQKEAIINNFTCRDCAFWHGKTDEITRGYGCRIWYLIQFEYGGSIPDDIPNKDGG